MNTTNEEKTSPHTWTLARSAAALTSSALWLSSSTCPVKHGRLDSATIMHKMYFEKVLSYSTKARPHPKCRNFLRIFEDNNDQFPTTTTDGQHSYLQAFLLQPLLLGIEPLLLFVHLQQSGVKLGLCLVDALVLRHRNLFGYHGKGGRDTLLKI